MYPKISNKFMEDVCKVKATPAIFYNLEIMFGMINSIKKKMMDIPNLRLFFSLKANRNVLLNKYISNVVDGADIASLEELKVAKESGYKDFVIYAPSFSEEEIINIYKDRFIFDFNSISQLRNVASKIYSQSIGIRLKVNLRFVEKESFGDNSRFGIELTKKNIKELEEIININNLNISKIHIHTGEKNIREFIKSIKYLEECLEKHPNLFEGVRTINLGGGFTRAYLIDKNFEEFILEIKKFAERQKHRDFEIIIEPGMLLTLFCGFLVTQVRSIDKKSTSETIDVLLDTSRFNLYQWTNTRPLFSSSKLESTNTYNFYGNSCYELDIFSRETSFNELQIGDKVVFSSAGAYLSSMQRTLHGLIPPYEYVWKGKYEKEGQEIIYV